MVVTHTHTHARTHEAGKKDRVHDRSCCIVTGKLNVLSRRKVSTTQPQGATYVYKFMSSRAVFVTIITTGVGQALLQFVALLTRQNYPRASFRPFTSRE